MRKDLNTYSDEDLLKILGNKEKHQDAAFKVLYERYSPHVLRYCRTMLRNKADSDDLFQNTFENFLNAVYSGIKILNIKSYLLKISRNLRLNKKVANNQELTEIPEVIDINESTLIDWNWNIEEEELSKYIEMALDVLPVNQKEAFILKEHHGLSYNQISELTGESIDNINNWLFRGKRKLRELLKPYLEN